MQHDEITNSFRIVVVTPLMRRCHQLQSSCKMVQNFLPCIGCEREFVKVFIDSCTDFVAHETVFMGIVMCGTPGGAVPLGMYLTNEMSIASMGLIFQGLLSAVGENAFCGRGTQGPESAMADDGMEIRGFLEVFPLCRRRRCCFHIYQNGNEVS